MTLSTSFIMHTGTKPIRTLLKRSRQCCCFVAHNEGSFVPFLQIHDYALCTDRKLIKNDVCSVFSFMPFTSSILAAFQYPGAQLCHERLTTKC